jgi:hypothetical protein
MERSNPLIRASGEPEEPAGRLSRRFFLKGSGAAVAGGLGIAAGRQLAPAQDAPPGDPVPAPPATPPAPVLRYFRPDQAALVEAMTARLIPGTPDDPGASEAGVVFFIDSLLANGDGFAEPTYRQPPFPQVYEGEAPPASGAGPNGAAQGIWVAADQIARYGFQSAWTPREAYQNSLPAVDRFATERFGATFVALDPRQQDQILMAIEDGKATGFDAPSASDFFSLLQNHAVQGMFSDPVYGGNRDMAGWRLVGYPGAQRGYDPAELKTEGTERQPQGLAQLAHFHTGRPEEYPVLPVRGSERFGAGE